MRPGHRGQLLETPLRQARVDAIWVSAASSPVAGAVRRNHVGPQPHGRDPALVQPDPGHVPDLRLLPGFPRRVGQRRVDGGHARDRVLGRGAAPGPQRVAAGRGLSLRPQPGPALRGQAVQIEHPPHAAIDGRASSVPANAAPGEPSRASRSSTVRPAWSRPPGRVPQQRRAPALAAAGGVHREIQQGPVPVLALGQAELVPAARLTRLVPGQPRLHRVLGPAQGQQPANARPRHQGTERVIGRLAAEVDLIAGAHRRGVPPGVEPFHVHVPS